jgi:diguanylate cyclase (GGDEF)-like protein
MDIDRFKAFNDTYGHVAGDSCLAQVAHAAGACLSRSTDLFARYGGEEFAAILHGVEPDDALAIAERMREAIAQLQIPHIASETGCVNASFGVACSTARCEDPRLLLRSADEALYAAKAAGRNRCSLQGRQLQTHSSMVTGNLLRPATPFIGRKVELEALSRSLALSRLTTILGPGGVGKTRCALAVAEHLRNAYAHGAWFVDFSAARDAATAEETVRKALHAPVESLAGKHCLLIFDRCDRVSEAVARLCDRILKVSPRTTIVATSRKPIASEHERIFHLSAMTHDDAEALFCERAAAAVPGTIFDSADRAAVREVCAALADLPLAITLAAPRTKTHTVRQLAEALRVRDAGASLEWSYKALDVRAQRLFERLAVFAGVFDADAARDICSFAPLRPGEAAAALDELIEANLVLTADATSEHFTLVEATREYAAARLHDRGDDEEAARRYTAYYEAIEQLLVTLG